MPSLNPKTARSSPGPRQTVSTRLLRRRDGRGEVVEDALAVEEPLEIAVSNKWGSHSLTVTLRTPGEERALACGFLFSEGIVRGREDVRSVRYREEVETTLPAQRITVRLADEVDFSPERHRRNFPISAACGACGKSVLEALRVFRDKPLRLLTGERVSETRLGKMAEQLRGVQTGFQATGGLHAAARFSCGGKLLSSAEDIGRHNAVDKLIGACLEADEMDWSGSILFLSGRLGYDLMQKAIVVGCPIVASVGAPSSLAVELASLFNITVIGFLKPDRFNVYSVPERIQFLDE